MKDRLAFLFGAVVFAVVGLAICYGTVICEKEETKRVALENGYQVEGFTKVERNQ